MLWISHRGESYDAPENTMKAFRLAWKRGTDGIELDIRLTADGQVVCIQISYDGTHHRRWLGKVAKVGRSATLFGRPTREKISKTHGG